MDNLKQSGFCAGIFLIIWGPIVISKLCYLSKKKYSRYKHPYTNLKVVEDPLCCGIFVLTAFLSILLLIAYIYLVVWVCIAFGIVFNLLFGGMENRARAALSCTNSSLFEQREYMHDELLNYLKYEKYKYQTMKTPDWAKKNSNLEVSFNQSRDNILTTIDKSIAKVKKQLSKDKNPLNDLDFNDIYDQKNVSESNLSIFSGILAFLIFFCIFCKIIIGLLYTTGLTLYLLILIDNYTLCIKQETILKMEYLMVQIFRILCYCILATVGIVTLCITLMTLSLLFYSEIGCLFTSYNNGDSYILNAMKFYQINFYMDNDVKLEDAVSRCKNESLYEAFKLNENLNMEIFLPVPYPSLPKKNKLEQDFIFRIKSKLVRLFYGSSCYDLYKYMSYMIDSLFEGLLLTLCSITLCLGLLILLDAIIFAIVFRLTGKMGEPVYILRRYQIMGENNNNRGMEVRGFKNNDNLLDERYNKSKNSFINSSGCGDWGVFISPPASLSNPPPRIIDV